MAEHRLPADLVQHLGGTRFHPRAFARREYDHGGRTGWAHSARLLDIAAGHRRDSCPRVHTPDGSRIPAPSRARRKEAAAAAAMAPSPPMAAPGRPEYREGALAGGPIRQGGPA